MPIGEFFSVHDDQAGKRYINFHQCSTQDPKDHPFSVKALRDWYSALGLTGEDGNLTEYGKSVTVRIIFYVDWTQTTQHGMKFKDETRFYAIGNLKEYEKKMMIFPEFENLETFMVRVGVYPNATNRPRQYLGNTKPNTVSSACLFCLSDLT